MYEPKNGKTYTHVMACLTNEDTDQPMHPCSLKFSLGSLFIAKDPKLFHVTVKTDVCIDASESLL